MAASARRIAYATVDGHDRHVTPAWHPERHERLVAVEEGVARAELGDGLVRIAPRPATDDELTSVHLSSYVRELTAIAEAGGGELDPDTPMAPGSVDTARWAAGLGLAAVDILRSGDADTAFVAPRPPGHHASINLGSGFCLFNNVAVTAMALANSGERVAIIDWDVHHGNGTQAIFWNDPRVLYASVHESPAYPFTGDPREVGGPRATGSTINVPLPAGATGDVALRAFTDVIAEGVDAFGPTWWLISAGFDAHFADPLANLCWSAGDFAALTREVIALAPRPSRTIAFLEGGYDLAALAASTSATLRALAGLPTPAEVETTGGPGMTNVERCRRLRNDRLEVMA